MGILGGLAILGLFFSLLITTLKLYKRNNQEEKITGDQKLLLGIILYLAIFQIILNFVTSNLLINFVLWLTLGMIFSIISDIKLKTEGEAYIISLFQNPLKIQLKTALAYIKANSKLIRTRKSKIL
jgi:O-antigen ligase